MRDIEKLNFKELEKETVEFITNNKFMAFSTCLQNHTSVRMVSIINDSLTVYFMTLKTMAKFRQLRDNPYIAFCIGNMEAEGIAEITCHPLEDAFFVEKYKMCHENTFKIYGQLQDCIIIKVKPVRISFWKYSANLGAYKDCLDVERKEAYREFYNTKARM